MAARLICVHFYVRFVDFPSDGHFRVSLPAAGHRSAFAAARRADRETEAARSIVSQQAEQRGRRVVSRESLVLALSLLDAHARSR
jgi:hypothetical protein